MRSLLSRTLYSGLSLAIGLALLGCSKDSAGGSGQGAGATTVGGGRSSVSATGGSTAGPGSQSSRGGGGAGATSGPGGSVAGGASGGVGKDAGAGTGASGGSVQAGRTADATTGSAGRSGGSSSGGITGSGSSGGLTSSGGSREAGGSGGIRDGGVRDASSAGGAGSGGKSSSGGSGGSTTSSSAGGSGGSSSSAPFTPCPGATQTLTVGSGQTYATVQSAVNAVSSGNSKWVQINVKAGTYKEQVTINKPFVCLVGESATSTTISYTIDNNIVTGGTVLVKANDFAAANIAFENSHGQGASGGQNQAVALMAQGQRHQFRNCRFISYQDTLYTNTGTQYFRDCFIQGSVDYIFGDATAVFEDCTMNNIIEGTAVSAPRTPQNTTYGFVFLGGSLTAASAVRSNHVNLGRPWGPYAAAAYLNVNMGAHITTEGWTTMSDNTLAQTRFSEYKSTGAGASTSSSTRSSRQLSDSQAANYTVAKVLSPWTPGYSQ